MVDIHSHFLYGVDDGAKTREDSLAMLKMAAEAGTTDIVATPHADLKYAFDPVLVESRLAELQAAAGSIIRLHRGCDFHLSFDNIRRCIDDHTAYSINGKGYLLVEFADSQIPATIKDVFEEMMSRRIVPIITHPERNRLLMKSLDQLGNWVEMGCLVQVTAQSFTGRFGNTARAACLELMDSHMVDFVAGDAHDTVHRPPDLREAHQIVTEKYGEETALRLFETNPSAAIEGRPIKRERPKRQKPSRPWYRFW